MRPPKVLNKIRAGRIAMVFQDPMTSLNPYMRVSDQMAEVLMLHKGMGKAAGGGGIRAMLDAVKIPDAKGRIRLYPHEFSGGMRQRVMIAMALLCKPDLLIADEPTTALDVTVQAQIMELLADLQRDFGMAMILITHDLGVIAGSAERVMVMYGGRVMERAPVDPAVRRPAHPYTQGLLAAIPRVDQKGDQLSAIPGSPPNMTHPPAGCPFAPRCAYVMEVCQTTMPPLRASPRPASVPAMSIDWTVRAGHAPLPDLPEAADDTDLDIARDPPGILEARPPWPACRGERR
jgi:oligopeptide transport system ATP-binding protein